LVRRVNVENLPHLPHRHGQYRLTKRCGKGVINIKTSERNGPVVALRSVSDEDELMLITAAGTLLRTKVSELREIGRATQGVRLIRMADEEDRVVAVAKIVREEDEEENGGGEGAPNGPSGPSGPSGSSGSSGSTAGPAAEDDAPTHR
jgi:DNA gyrase subunit A